MMERRQCDLGLSEFQRSKLCTGTIKQLCSCCYFSLNQKTKTPKDTHTHPNQTVTTKLKMKVLLGSVQRG
jgi:hypothetical protein